MKKIFQLFLAITLVFAISACTSKKVDDQTDDATADMTGEESGDISEEDFGGEEGSETASTDEAPADESSGEVTESTDAAPVDENAAVDESALAESSDTAAEPPPEATDSTDSSDMEGLAASEETPSDSTSETPSDSLSETPSDMSSETPTDSLSDSSLADTSTPMEEAPAPAVVPLRKIEATPWTQGNTLVNAVYLARQGDSFASVSQKIYGSEDKVSEMKKINPTIARREMKVGDKVYYNSPKRPTDNTQLLTFYEDNGLAPETYVSQPGDNIRTVSKNLLGDNNSWKEIWATNADVESKSDLPEGTRLRYWAGEVAAPVVAQQETPPPVQEDPSAAAAGAVAMENTPPPPSEPPPPMPDEVAQQAQMAPPPPVEESLPPEPVVAEAPPAPIDAGMAAEGASGNPLADLLGGEDQTTALMIGALFLIAAAALFIIIKKRKSKKNIDFQTATHTQIE